MGRLGAFSSSGTHGAQFSAQLLGEALAGFDQGFCAVGHCARSGRSWLIKS